jgi:hypothetical protein
MFIVENILMFLGVGCLCFVAGFIVRYFMQE